MVIHWFGCDAIVKEEYRVWSACGIRLTKDNFVTNEHKVTCKRCQKKIEKIFYPDGR